MKQYEQVIKIMRENNGYATLSYLNRFVDVSEWKTRTPYASIRRIVQDERFFFKIKPGLWALKEYREQILKNFKIDENNTKNEKDDFSHSYFQGLLVEIGKMKGFTTYIPPQDKNKKFLNESLGKIADTTEIFNFSYYTFVKRAKTIDVIWFNERNMPSSFFEVEHSTDIQNSLIKFYDLQDFFSGFYIVSSKDRKKEFYSKINRDIFKSLKERVNFLDYEYIANLHVKTSELFSVGGLLQD